MWNIVVTWRTSGIFVHIVTQSLPLSLSTSLSHHVILKVTLPLLDVPWPQYPPTCFVHKVTFPLSLHWPFFSSQPPPSLPLILPSLRLPLLNLSSFCFLHPVYHLSLPLFIPPSSFSLSSLFLFSHFPIHLLQLNLTAASDLAESEEALQLLWTLCWPWGATVHIWWEERFGAVGGSEYMDSLHYCRPAWYTGEMGG